MLRDFGKPIVDDSTTSPGANKGYTLDETKLTPERIKAFGHDVSQDVANYSQQMELAERTFKRCEDNGMKFSPEQKEKIMKQLTPTLNSLGSEHVEKNMDALATDLSNKLKDNRSLVSRITGKESISSATLEKITMQISAKEKPLSINASLRALEEKKMEHSTAVANSHTNPNQDWIKKYNLDFNARVQYFAMQNGIMDPVGSKEPIDIAKIRLINPKAFDEAVFSQKTQNRSADEVMHTAKGAQAIDEITHSKAMPEAKKPRPDAGIRELRDLDRQLQANKKDYQAMDGVAAQEAHGNPEARKPKPLPLTPPQQREKQAQQADNTVHPRQTPTPPPKPAGLNQRGSHGGGHEGH
jgi:hypothetical protein